jgi:membrane associated rhomboid family serine protease
VASVSQPTVPVCYRHPTRETYLRCSRCDRPICPDCMNDAAVGHHCPECAREGRRTQRPARTAFGGTMAGQHGHVTKTLIGINILVAVLAIALGGAQAVAGGAWGGLLGGSTTLHFWGGMVVGNPGVTIAYTDPAGQVLGTAAGVVNGDYYRMITSMFLHYGLFHLLLNMWALWVVGGVLEPLLGRARFLALYLISGLGGSVAVYLTAGIGIDLFNRPLFGELSTLTAGASGAVFGLFGAFYVILRRLGRDTSMITMILVINIIFTFTVPAISVAGHMGGLVTGALVAAGLAYAPRQHRTPVQVATIGVIAVLLVALTLARTVALT